MNFPVCDKLVLIALVLGAVSTKAHAATPSPATSPASRHIGIPKVNYGAGTVTVVDNMITCQNSNQDRGVCSALWRAIKRNVLSFNNIQNIPATRKVALCQPSGSLPPYTQVGE